VKARDRGAQTRAKIANSKYRPRWNDGDGLSTSFVDRHFDIGGEVSLPKRWSADD
jgi:hypothetical protein